MHCTWEPSTSGRVLAPVPTLLGTPNRGNHGGIAPTQIGEPPQLITPPRSVPHPIPNRTMVKFAKGQLKQKIFLILALLGFLNLTATGIVKPLLEAVQGPGLDTSDTPAMVQTPNPLASQEQGYGLVLEREPTNTTALRGLVDVRVESGNIAGAIAALDRLMAVTPEDETLATERANLVQQLPQDSENLAPTTPETPETQP